MFFIVAVPIYISTRRAPGFPFLHILASILLLTFLFVCFVFLGLYPQNIEVARLVVESELPGYATATAM